MTRDARHILISIAVTVRPVRPSQPESEKIRFNDQCGFWCVGDSSLPAILSHIYSNVRRVSKKRDLETGEDQKGE